MRLRLDQTPIANLIAWVLFCFDPLKDIITKGLEAEKGELFLMFCFTQFGLLEMRSFLKIRRPLTVIFLI